MGILKKLKMRIFLNKYLNDDVKGLNPRKLKSNVLSLPTFLAPESYYYFILKKISNDHKFWQQLGRLNLPNDYTSYRLEELLQEVVLHNDNIQNEDLKKVFFGDKLERIKNFIDETQTLTYYYNKNPQELSDFKKEIKKVFNIVENKVKANL